MRGETVNRGGKSTGRGEGGPPRRGLGRGRATGKTTQGFPPPQVTRGGPREARDAGRPRPSKKATPRGIASSIPLSRTRPGPHQPAAETRHAAPGHAWRAALLSPPPSVRQPLGPDPGGSHTLRANGPRAAGRARLRTVPAQRAAGCASGRGRRPGDQTTPGTGRRPSLVPSPPAHGHVGGKSRAHTRTDVPEAVASPRRNAGQARRDPPPTRRGEARATGVRQRQHRAPPGEGPPSAQHGKRDAQAPSLTRFRRGGGWGVRYPKAPSRIAREGFLTEGVSPPPHRAPLRRAREGAGPSNTGAGRGRPREQEELDGSGTGGVALSAKPPGQCRALAIGAVGKGTARAASGATSVCPSRHRDPQRRG